MPITLLFRSAGVEPGVRRISNPTLINKTSNMPVTLRSHGAVLLAVSF